MHTEHLEIFKQLVRAYYYGDFEALVEQIIADPSFNKQDAMHIISALCGVDVSDADEFSKRIRQAIKDNHLRKHIVEKLPTCTKSCEQTEDEKSPCQLICPVSAIIDDPITGISPIDKELCIDCGLCIDACKEKKILDRIEFFPLMELIKDHKKIIAAVAPAISGQWGASVSLEQLRAAFIKLGFEDMVEVALAADILTIKEAVEYNEHVQQEGDTLITSCCCPIWVGMLKKVYHKLIKDISPSVSPMIAMGRILKTLDPETIVVFIGPCIAKKKEGHEEDIAGAIDYVLTFEELKGIFEVLEINPETLEGTPSNLLASKSGRIYARTGGVSTAVEDVVKDLFPERSTIFTATKADGVKECKTILNTLMEGKVSANFIEGMACVGGCVGGPKAIVSREQGTLATNLSANATPFQVATHNSSMKEILAQLGITRFEDFNDPQKIILLERRFSS